MAGLESFKRTPGPCINQRITMHVPEAAGFSEGSGKEKHFKVCFKSLPPIGFAELSRPSGGYLTISPDQHLICDLLYFVYNNRRENVHSTILSIKGMHLPYRFEKSKYEGNPGSQQTRISLEPQQSCTMFLQLRTGRPSCFPFDYVLKSVPHLEVQSDYSEHLIHTLQWTICPSDVYFT